MKIVFVTIRDESTGTKDISLNFWEMCINDAQEVNYLYKRKALINVFISTID